MGAHDPRAGPGGGCSAGQRCPPDKEQGAMSGFKGFLGRFGLVVATSVVTASLAGTGVASAIVTIPNNSVSSIKIVDDTVRSIDVRNGTLRGVDIADGTVG